MGADIYIKAYDYLTGIKKPIPFDKDKYAYFLSDEVNDQIDKLRSANRNYKELDRTVLLSLHLADRLKEDLEGMDCGINIGTARGASTVWESNYQRFKREEQIDLRCSPLTTAGNVSSWLAQHLKSGGVDLSHSVTCSSAHHAILNGIAWLGSSMCSSFLAGGSEAAITPFTLKQLDVLGIYSTTGSCVPFQFENPTGMLLGEGAGLFLLDKDSRGAKAQICGWGFAQEKINSATSMDKDGAGYVSSMQQALKTSAKEKVDLVIAHAPGTRMGDRAELRAVEAVLGKGQTMLSVKGLWGHALGASGAQGLGFALDLLTGAKDISICSAVLGREVVDIQSIMVNAAGFGGNVASIILERT